MKTKIKDFIKEIETQNLKDDSYFGFYQYGGAKDESYIKANREGLKMYAIELLKASINESEEFNLNTEKWHDKDATFFFRFIEIIEAKRNGKKRELPEYEETFKDKTFKIGCVFTFIIIAVIFLTGIATVLEWLFKK